ncbi:MAG: exodeoxyribonuclease VII small subunit [Bowdeniella nasicola]|nr:exodeoxyribonuclease VII small subunit [Bowdeniella nasicola]
MTDNAPKTAGPNASGSTPLGPDPADLGYEQARDELVAVVQKLESGQAGLEESLRLWERGEALAARCEEWLAGARAALSEARERGTADSDAQGTAQRHGTTAEGAQA